MDQCSGKEAKGTDGDGACRGSGRPAVASFYNVTPSPTRRAPRGADECSSDNSGAWSDETLPPFPMEDVCSCTRAVCGRVPSECPGTAVTVRRKRGKKKAKGGDASAADAFDSLPGAPPQAVDEVTGGTHVGAYKLGFGQAVSQAALDAIPNYLSGRVPQQNRCASRASEADAAAARELLVHSVAAARSYGRAFPPARLRLARVH